MKKAFKKGTDYTDIREWIDEQLLEEMENSEITDEDLDITIKYTKRGN